MVAPAVDRIATARAAPIVHEAGRRALQLADPAASGLDTSMTTTAVPAR